MRKLFIAILILIIISLTLYVFFSKENHPDSPKGKIINVEKSAESAIFQLKDYLLKWDAEKRQLSITAVTNTSQILWHSVEGESFVMAAIGKETISGKRAHYTVSDDISQIFVDQSVRQFEQRSDNSATISGSLKNDSIEIPYQIKFVITTENHLQFQISSENSPINRLYLVGSSNAEEHYFGFGEQFTYFNLKGHRVPIFIGEQGLGRGAEPITTGSNIIAGAGGDWHTTYAAVPQYLTNQLRSLCLENSEYSIFDLREANREVINVFSNTMTGRIFSGETPLVLIDQYTDYAGKMRKLPDWILDGAVLGLQGGTERVKGIYEQIKARNAPIAALWLQDWVGQRTTSFGKQLWWNWELDEDHYPNWDEFQKTLRADSVKTMTYINSFLADVSQKSNVKRHLFEEAKMRGFLVKTKTDEPYLIQNTDFSAAMIDLTNPEARNWLIYIIRKLVISQGVSGWMADFGEALPPDAKLFSGEDAFAYHNQYAADWAKINREAIDILPKAQSDEMVFFTRSGYTQSPKYTTLMWLGDQMVSWDEHDGIKSAVTGLLSSGISGYSLNHSDIGGYTTITHFIKNYHRSKELFMRWTELNAFSVIFRTHEGNQPENNHQFYSDEETMTHFAKFATVYAAWADYRKKLVAEAAETGAPIVRHLFLHYPNDPEVLKIRNEQFLVGDQLLVAPVLDEGVTTKRFYLPKGEWQHLWSKEVFNSNGKYIEIDAPIGKPPVFFHPGSDVGKNMLVQLKLD